MKKFRFLLLMTVMMCTTNALATIMPINWNRVKIPNLSMQNCTLNSDGNYTLPVNIEIPDNSTIYYLYGYKPGCVKGLTLSLFLENGLELDIDEQRFAPFALNNGRISVNGKSFTCKVSSATFDSSDSYGNYYTVKISLDEDFVEYYNSNWSTIKSSITGTAFSMNLRCNSNFLGGSREVRIGQLSTATFSFVDTPYTDTDVYLVSASCQVSCGYEEGDVPEFSFNPLSLKPGKDDYMELNMTAHNMPITNIKMSIYVPDGFTISTSSFGVSGRQPSDGIWKKAEYNASNKCYDIELGSFSGRYTFSGESGVLFDFNITAPSTFNQSQAIVVKNVSVTLVTKREIAIDNFSGAITYDNTKEVSPNATKFSMGELMTPGEISMLKGSSAIIPIRMTWGTLDAPRQVSGTFLVPDGLQIDSLTQNPDVQPNNFNRNNFRCVKTGTGKWQFITISNYPNYWRTPGTAPCFYLYVSGNENFDGGVITMTNLETVTQKTTDSGKYYCADATCNINVISLTELRLSTAASTIEVTPGGTASLPVSARWDSRDRVYRMEVYFTVPDGITPTTATISENRALYGHKAQLHNDGNNTYHVTIYNNDQDEYIYYHSGELFTLDLKVNRGFENGDIVCNSVYAKTKYYPGGMDNYIKFNPVNLFASPSQQPLHGDVNNDGNVNSGDVSTLYNVILETITDPEIIQRSDINGDNSVNAGDVSALYQLIMTQ